MIAVGPLVQSSAARDARVMHLKATCVDGAVRLQQLRVDEGARMGLGHAQQLPNGSWVHRGIRVEHQHVLAPRFPYAPVAACCETEIARKGHQADLWVAVAKPLHHAIAGTVIDDDNLQWHTLLAQGGQACLEVCLAVVCDDHNAEERCFADRAKVADGVHACLVATVSRTDTACNQPRRGQLRTRTAHFSPSATQACQPRDYANRARRSAPPRDLPRAWRFHARIIACASLAGSWRMALFGSTTSAVTNSTPLASCRPMATTSLRQ